MRSRNETPRWCLGADRRRCNVVTWSALLLGRPTTYEQECTASQSKQPSLTDSLLFILLVSSISIERSINDPRTPTKQADEASSTPNRTKQADEASSIPNRTKKADEASSIPNRTKQANEASSIPNRTKQAGEASSTPNRTKNANEASSIPNRTKQADEASITDQEHRNQNKKKQQKSVKDAEKLAATDTRQLPQLPRRSLPKPIARWPTLRGPPAASRSEPTPDWRWPTGKHKEALVSLQDLNKDSVVIIMILMARAK
jgi:hypothetical protein